MFSKNFQELSQEVPSTPFLIKEYSETDRNVPEMINSNICLVEQIVPSTPSNISIKDFEERIISSLSTDNSSRLSIEPNFQAMVHLSSPYNAINNQNKIDLAHIYTKVDPRSNFQKENMMKSISKSNSEFISGPNSSIDFFREFSSIEENDYSHQEIFINENSHGTPLNLIQFEISQNRLRNFIQKKRLMTITSMNNTIQSRAFVQLRRLYSLNKEYHIEFYETTDSKINKRTIDIEE